MTFYTYTRKAWRNRDTEQMRDVWRNRLKEWREEDAITRIENPTRLAKARSLGYKAKTGIILVRGRIQRGGRKRPSMRGGRKPKHAGRNKYTPKKNLKGIMEQRVSQQYPNLEVLNSYPVAEDGIHKWFEHILVDPYHPTIKKDDNYSDLASQKGRAERGLTTAGKKSRGLQNKGTGSEKARPSNQANRNREK